MSKHKRPAGHKGALNKKQLKAIRVKFEDWAKKESQFIKDIEASERITGEDLAIRINV